MKKFPLVGRVKCFETLPGCKGWSFGRRICLVRAASILAVFMMGLSSLALGAKGESFSSNEIKAAFLYKFLLFVEWPEGTFQEADDKITIGFFDDGQISDFLVPVEGQYIDGRSLVVECYKKGTTRAFWEKCQLLFIDSSMEPRTKEILESLNGRPILTVGETEGFLEQGGMVNFFTREGSVRFEINKTAAAKVGIKFRSKLLRVANRIIMDGYGYQQTN